MTAHRENGGGGTPSNADALTLRAPVAVDQSMPIMDGRSFIVALRAVDPNVAVIAASGLEGGKHVAGPEAMRADAFVSKPFLAESLLTALREVLDKRIASS
jgi:CheY-like chemotaxis protein